MKIAILTLGCRTNQAESLHIEHELIKTGHQIVDISEDPEICIINTCTVTSKADYESRQLVQRALKNNSKVIATGCYAELNNEYIKKIDSTIQLVKNNEKNNIINIIPKNTSDNTSIKNSPSRHRPIVKVQDGCNYSCSYCAIPAARGKSRSEQIERIIDTINFHDSLGFKEVVLTGIHLGTYGWDLKPKKSLSLLLKDILLKTKIPRIRLSSLEVREVDNELLELMTDNRVCKHLHVPLQSGDDNILKFMNRTYSVSEFANGLDAINKKLPYAAIGTDVIVGFPGEGSLEFNNTKTLIEAMPFSYLHVFPYSTRPGTKAMEFGNRVSDVIKKDRVMQLRETSAAKKNAYIQRNLGGILDVVVEKQKNGGIAGTTGNYIKVHIEGSHDLDEGMLVNVRLAEHKNNITRAIPVKFSQLTNK